MGDASSPQLPRNGARASRMLPLELQCPAHAHAHTSAHNDGADIDVQASTFNELAEQEAARLLSHDAVWSQPVNCRCHHGQPCAHCAAAHTHTHVRGRDTHDKLSSSGDVPEPCRCATSPAHRRAARVSGVSKPSGAPARPPAHVCVRVCVLALSVIGILGPYYAFDTPAATVVSMREAMGAPASVNINSSASDNATFASFGRDFQLLYTLYSLPNTVLPLLGGVLIDRIGVRSMTIATSSAALAGQVMVVAGVSARSWPLMWCGRVLFGIGTESLCVCQRIIVARWFMGAGLGIALGVTLAFGRLGSVINDNISALYTAQHVLGAYCIAALLCAISLAAVLAVVWLDTVYGKGEDIEEAEDTGKHPAVASLSVSEQVLKNVLQIRRLPWCFWLLCAIALCGFPPITTFNGVGALFLQQRASDLGENSSAPAVNATLGILYTVAAVLAPFVGGLIDRIPVRSAFIAAAQALIGTCHALFNLTNLPAAPIMGLLGLGFATFASAFWPAIAVVAPADIAGIAFGVAGSLQNVGLAVTPMIVATLEPPACGATFQCVEVLFACMAAFAVITALLLFRCEEHRLPPCSLDVFRWCSAADAKLSMDSDQCRAECALLDDEQ